jgi:lipopolysaccharide/colanic/teichoic acid biosynthesis glycosyltransferase
LPQLINILLGQMSFVGPRPDIEGYYDNLKGENRKILELKPGLTSLASIKYSNEEEILAKQNDPLKYNDEIIFPDKVKMNLDYFYNRSFYVDLIIIFKTIFRK